MVVAGVHEDQSVVLGSNPVQEVYFFGGHDMRALNVLIGAQHVVLIPALVVHERVDIRGLCGGRQERLSVCDDVQSAAHVVAFLRAPCQ